jgi:hypothetical protein
VNRYGEEFASELEEKLEEESQDDRPGVKTMSQLATTVCAAMLLVLLAGCGGNQPTLVPVTGKVTMAGQPLTAGSIIFHPDSANSFQDDKPSSLLQIDGSFTLQTFPFGEGVPPGKYKVTLAPELASRIGRPQFADPLKTPWSVEIPAEGLSGHNFEVPGKPK